MLISFYFFQAQEMTSLSRSIAQKLKDKGNDISSDEVSFKMQTCDKLSINYFLSFIDHCF